MRKLLLNILAVAALVPAFSQGSVPTPRLVSPVNFKTVESHAGSGSVVSRRIADYKYSSESSRAISFTPLGTSGNPFTIINNNVNQIDFISNLNTVAFVHRTNNKIFISDDANNSQYRYDISKDNGATWTLDVGLLNPSGTQAGFACRFPNGLLFNPAGNTNNDSAFMCYVGAFHDGGTSADWKGYCHGRAQTNNSPFTFTERRYEPNLGLTNIMHSMQQSRYGEFWGIDVKTTDGTDIDGLLPYKGVWNADSNAIVWSARPELVPPFDLSADGKGHMIGYSIGFDPSGRFGWIGGVADLQNSGEATYDPFFYKSSDFGNSWEGPIVLDIDSIEGITYDPVNGPASSTFEVSMTVDIYGNPHMAMILIPASTTTAYSVIGNAPDKYLYDITYDSTYAPECRWRAIQLDYINSLRKDIVANSLSMDNYVRTSRSADGSKVFVTWVDTDSAFGLNLDNDFPDFKGIGLDMVTGKRTNVKNFSTGDVVWGGNVLWPSTSPTAKTTGSTHNIPTVFSRMNAANNDLDTCYFFYVSNINFTNTEFNTNIDNAAPDINLVGSDLTWVPVGGTFVDSGAVAFDCIDGDLTSSIVRTGLVNTGVAGTYVLVYKVCDGTGNCDSVERTVRVANPPVCTFTVENIFGGRYRFLYTNPGSLATSWDYNYGDGTGKINALSAETKNYTTNGTYTVKLTARNPVGTCTKDTVLNVLKVGIEDINISSEVSIFPNPANEVLNVSVDLPIASTFSLTNLIGEVILTGKLAANGETLGIDVSKMSNGVYLFRVESELGIATKKIYIQHK